MGEVARGYTHADRPFKTHGSGVGTSHSAAARPQLSPSLESTPAHARGLWEVGYAVLNILLQARALEVAYGLMIPDEAQTAFVREKLQLPDATALVGFRAKGELSGL